MRGPGDRGAGMTADVGRVVDAVWRMESARLLGALTRVVGDVGLAEELAQDALVAALEQWPADGVPDRPGAWLMTAAKRRAIDSFRRAERFRAKAAEIGRGAEQDQETEPDWAAALDQPVEDDVLRLMLIACHPVLSREARVALTLRLVGGLTTDEIARAFLVPESTVAQRIVRAKRSLTAAKVPFEVPIGPDLTARLSSVLEVLYLVFNEGYAATAGESWVRADLCAEALRLGRILAALTPRESEVHGLVALMELQASRLRARMNRRGEPVLLADQDRGRWDRLLITRGLAALELAEVTARAASSALGPYAVQAAIAACHARARSLEETDWVRIAALYEVLGELTPSPVVELNRAVAVSRAYGPEAGLEIIDALAEAPALRGYHLLPSARGDLLIPPRSCRGGARGVRPGRGADPQRARAGAAAGAGGSVGRLTGQAGGQVALAVAELVGAGLDQPPARDRAVRAGGRSRAEHRLDPAPHLGLVVRCRREDDPDVERVVRAVHGGVVRRQRARWRVLPAAAERQRHRPARRPAVGVGFEEEDGAMHAGLPARHRWSAVRADSAAARSRSSVVRMPARSASRRFPPWKTFSITHQPSRLTGRSTS